MYPGICAPNHNALLQIYIKDPRITATATTTHPATQTAEITSAAIASRLPCGWVSGCLSAAIAQKTPNSTAPTTLNTRAAEA